jgi:hypothetical protein
MATAVTYQYMGTKVIHFLFILLRIKDLYVFRAFIAHPQEGLQNGTLYIVYWCSAVCVAPPEDEQVMLETCRGP